MDDGVGLELHVRVDPRGHGIDNGDARLEMAGDDLIAELPRGSREIGSSVHAFADTRILRTVHGDLPSVIHQMAHGVGEVELALRVVRVEVGEPLPERVGVEGVDG